MIQEFRRKNTKQPLGMLGAIDQKGAVMGSKPWSGVITDGGAEPAEVLEFADIAKERRSGLFGIRVHKSTRIGCIHRNNSM